MLQAFICGSAKERVGHNLAEQRRRRESLKAVCLKASLKTELLEANPTLW